MEELQEKKFYIVEDDEAGCRIDKFIAEHMPDQSRSYLKSLIEKDMISLNQKAIKKASVKLKTGDEVSVIIPEPVKLEILAENIPLEIVYEDDDLIVVNKPQGMVVHPAPGNYTGTLVNALMYHCGDSLSSINGVMRPGIVHRIDKDTSGLLVICKNDFAHKDLAEQFAVHSINRIYTAIVYNHFNEESGTISKPIDRSKNDRKKMCIDEDGRHAVTHYEIKQSLHNNFTEIQCKLETGRTHQIRVHMASIGHPLLGDPVYGPAKCPYTLNGQMLHAGTLGFIHPRTGEYVEFNSPLPDYFTKILNLLSQFQNSHLPIENVINNVFYGYFYFHANELGKYEVNQKNIN